MQLYFHIEYYASKVHRVKSFIQFNLIERSSLQCIRSIQHQYEAVAVIPISQFGIFVFLLTCLQTELVLTELV